MRDQSSFPSLGVGGDLRVFSLHPQHLPPSPPSTFFLPYFWLFFLSETLSLKGFVWPVSYKSWQFLVSYKAIEMISEFHRWRRRGLMFSLCFVVALISLKTCGPLWAQQCGSQYYTTGVCSDVSPDFQLLTSFAPAVQSKWWMCSGSEKYLTWRGKVGFIKYPQVLDYFVPFAYECEDWITNGNVSFLFSSVACPSLIDVVVVCDESNSIYPWEAVKNFLEKFVQGLDIGPKKTQVWIWIIHTLTHSFLSEKIWLDLRSSFLHLSDPYIKCI